MCSLDLFQECLMDVLQYPEGPNVRDKISHGEADIFQFPQVLANHLLCLSAAICAKWLKPNCSLPDDPFLQEIICSGDNYQSVYHPISLMKEEVCNECMDNLIHWGQDKMAAIFQTFSNAFFWMKMYKFQLRFHCLFPRVQLTIFQHWFK